MMSGDELSVLAVMPPGQSPPALPEGFGLDRVPDADTARSRLDAGHYDCLLVPEEQLAAIRQTHPTVPAVVLLSTVPESIPPAYAGRDDTAILTRAQALDAPAILGHRIRPVVGTARDHPYRALFRGMNEGAAVHELIYDDTGEPVDYRLLEANPAFESILGISRDAAAGRRASELYEAEDPPYLDRYAAVVETGESVEFESYYPPLGSHFRISAFPVGEAGFATVFADITDMRETESELKSRLAEVNRLSEYRRVMSAVNQKLVEGRRPDAVLEEITEAIASGPRFTCAQIELLAETERIARCRSKRHPSDATLAAAHAPQFLDAVFEEGTLYIQDIDTRTDEHAAPVAGHDAYSIALTHEREEFGVLTVTFAAETPIDDMEIELLEELASDIGLFLYAQQVESHLREREERLDLALEGANLGVWDWDMETDEVYRDDRYAEMLGYDPAELGGTVEDWAELLHPNARETHDEALEKHLQGEDPLYTCEYRLRTADGEWKWIRNIGKVLEWNEQGAPKRAVGVHQDIDDRRRTRQRLERNNELLHAIDRVLRHNTNNHMNVIEGFASTIADRAGEPASTMAERIVRSSQTLLDTLDKERRITGLIQEETTTERLDLTAVLDRVRTRLETEYPAADLTVACPDGIGVLAIQAIEEAIGELVTNSIIHAESAHPTVNVAVTEGTEWVTVTVTDDGPGIPEMERNVLQRRSDITPLYHGSGLGLWFVGLVVDRSDGLIEYDQPEAGGSTVHVKLPPA